MPPKDGKKQGTAGSKDQQKLSIDDLLFPRTTIASLAKEGGAHADKSAEKDEELRKVVLSKDAVTALQRSATIFVNHLLMYAREGAAGQGRKSCSVDDVLSALVDCGMEGLEMLVRSKLDAYQRALELRKSEKGGLNSKDSPEADGSDVGEDVEERSEEPSKKQKVQEGHETPA